MLNFKQEIFRFISGIYVTPTKGIFQHERGVKEYYYNSSNQEKIKIVKEVSDNLIKSDDKYVGFKIYRKKLTDTEAQQICDALDNKEGFLQEKAIHDSLSDTHNYKELGEYD